MRNQGLIQRSVYIYEVRKIFGILLFSVTKKKTKPKDFPICVTKSKCKFAHVLLSSIITQHFEKLLMKIKTVYILIQLILISSIGYAQDANKIKMNKEVRQLIKLGKDSIIQLALPLIDKKASLENFSHISVQSNGTEVYVVFSNPVMYVPINSKFYNNIGVNLTTKSIFRSSVANPVELTTTDNNPYYIQTEDIKKNIEFVIDAIGSLDMADVANFKGQMHILEKEDHYDISVVSEVQESRYKIKKITGEMYEEGHAHLEPEPYIENVEGVFKEIHFPKEHK